MLVYWIPETTNTLPANASHRVGVGAIVVNDKREVLALIYHCLIVLDKCKTLSSLLVLLLSNIAYPLDKGSTRESCNNTSACIYWFS